MIHAILILSEDGEAFVFRFFNNRLTQLQRQDLIKECHLHLARRTQYMTNFVEFPGSSVVKKVYGTETRMVYRNHEGHFFVFLISATESELYTLNLIATLINSFERKFGKWWARDMVLKLDESLLIIDEMVQDGLVCYASSDALMSAMHAIEAFSRATDEKSILASAERMSSSVSNSADKLMASVAKSSKKKTKRFSTPKLPTFMTKSATQKAAASKRAAKQKSDSSDIKIASPANQNRSSRGHVTRVSSSATVTSVSVSDVAKDVSRGSRGSSVTSRSESNPYASGGYQ